MSLKGHSNKTKFILIPFSFLVIGYLVVFLMALPFLNAVASTTDLLFFDTKVQSKPMDNIFSSAPTQQGTSVKLSGIVFPQYGTKFGRLVIPSASIQADLYFGDGSQELKKGAGLYNGSFIPGYGGTILIAGHNHTYFHRLGQAKTGDTITIETSYGTYQYQVTKAQIKDATDKTAYDLDSKKENLVLYTCYPFDCIGLTPQRYYVYADYLSGPKIDKQG
jgi:sortase A